MISPPKHKKNRGVIPMSFMQALETGLHFLSNRTKNLIRCRRQARAENLPEPKEPTVQTVTPIQQRVSVPSVRKSPSSQGRLASKLYGQMMNDKYDVTARHMAASELSFLRKRSDLTWLELGLPMHTQNHIKQVLALTPTASPKAPSRQTATRSERARALYEAGKYSELRQLKRKVKIGWEALGFNQAEISTITQS